MNEGVHRTHCCVIHGCKYGDVDCPVEYGIIEQDYPCQDCNGVYPNASDNLFNESFYNWLLENGVLETHVSNPFSSEMENPLKCTLDMQKLKDGIDRLLTNSYLHIEQQM